MTTIIGGGIAGLVFSPAASGSLALLRAEGADLGDWRGRLSVVA